MSAELIWENFITHLNEVDRIGTVKAPLEHKTLFGSIEKYKKIFLEANLDIFLTDEATNVYVVADEFSPISVHLNHEKSLEKVRELNTRQVDLGTGLTTHYSTILPLQE